MNNNYRPKCNSKENHLKLSLITLKLNLKLNPKSEVLLTLLFHQLGFNWKILPETVFKSKEDHPMPMRVFY